jgi:hypothetical protein
MAVTHHHTNRSTPLFYPQNDFHWLSLLSSIFRKAEFFRSLVQASTLQTIISSPLKLKSKIRFSNFEFNWHTKSYRCWITNAFVWRILNSKCLNAIHLSFRTIDSKWNLNNFRWHSECVNVLTFLKNSRLLIGFRLNRFYVITLDKPQLLPIYKLGGSKNIGSITSLEGQSEITYWV